MNEVERIKEIYNNRKIQQKEKLYSYFNKGNLYIVKSRERVILGFLNKFNFLKLSDKKILGVSCGIGGGIKGLY